MPQVIDKESAEKILGNSKEVLVYGLKDCHYDKVGITLSSHYTRYYFDSPIFKFPFDDDSYSTRDNRKYKATLASVIAINFARTKYNESLLPVLFCVEFHYGQESKKLDINRVISNSSITDKELHRAYKLYAETNEELKAIAAKTFRFVKVNTKLDLTNTLTYSLESLKPFWEDPQWQAYWQDRNKKETQDVKRFPWKKVLNDEIQKTNSSTFFAKHDAKQLIVTGESSKPSCTIIK